MSRVLCTIAAFGGIAHSPKRAYNRMGVSLMFVVAARDGLRRFVERAGRKRVACGLRAIRRLEFEENRAWPTQAGTAPQALSVSSSFYASSARVANPVGGLTSHLPSSLLLARSPRATSLRLCVGPAVQVSQALPRGGAESDFSALRGNIAKGPISKYP